MDIALQTPMNDSLQTAQVTEGSSKCGPDSISIIIETEITAAKKGIELEMESQKNAQLADPDMFGPNSQDALKEAVQKRLGTFFAVDHRVSKPSKRSGSRCFKKLDKCVTFILHSLLDWILKFFFGILILAITAGSYDSLIWILSKFDIDMMAISSRSWWNAAAVSLFQIYYAMVFVLVLTGAGKPFFSRFNHSGLIPEFTASIFILTKVFVESASIVMPKPLAEETQIEGSLWRSGKLSLMECLKLYLLPSESVSSMSLGIHSGKYFFNILLLWYFICMAEWRMEWNKWNSVTKAVASSVVGKNVSFCKGVLRMGTAVGELLAVVAFTAAMFATVMYLEFPKAAYVYLVFLSGELVYTASCCVSTCLIGWRTVNYKQIMILKPANDFFVMLIAPMMTFTYQFTIYETNADQREWKYLDWNCLGPLVSCSLCMYIVVRFFIIRFNEAQGSDRCGVTLPIFQKHVNKSSSGKNSKFPTGSTILAL